ncbi:hypothetical protein [Ramlibacter sp.]|uniref:hypothetical protein n=1 Tax=Ramlibacter sp. TaxID=1917967 RepID=UPI002D107D2D|nr:hypothetical protein [Ramlibacter sp.]HWI82820.1 hypothetical protein [Ramlibacter sp.]
MRQVLVPAVLAIACGCAAAKLPPPDDAAKAKAAETAAKNAWQAKVDAYQLCKAQDRVAAQYRKSAGAQAAKPSLPATSSGALAAASAAASAASVSAKGGAAVAAPAASAASASGTPVAAAPPAPCADPGPFAYNPPEQKPLETSGAHSPSGTAASPPSVKEHSGQMPAPKKP